MANSSSYSGDLLKSVKAYVRSELVQVKELVRLVKYCNAYGDAELVDLIRLQLSGYVYDECSLYELLQINEASELLEDKLDTTVAIDTSRFEKWFGNNEEQIENEQ